jgi:hypothetical protein
LQRLTQALKQLSDGLDAEDAGRNRRGIAAQLREATKQLEEARAAGAPYFAGIGDTLPTDLADLAALAADLLLALEEDPLRERELKTGDEALPSAQRLIQTVMTAQQAKEKQPSITGCVEQASILKSDTSRTQIPRCCGLAANSAWCWCLSASGSRHGRR